MAFYKLNSGQHEFLFQLANLEVREDFAVWDNTNKRFLRQVEGVNNIDDLKFMKADLFAQRYPKFRKVSQYIRSILVFSLINASPKSMEGNESLRQAYEQCDFGFKKSANDQIIDEIRNRQQLGRDPLDYTFKYRKTGAGLATTHVVVVMQEVGKPQGVNVQGIIQPISVMDAINLNLSQNPIIRGLPPSLPQKPLESPAIRLEGVSGEVKLGLTPQEQTIVDLFNQDKQIYSEDLFVDVFINTLSKHFKGIVVIPDRIRHIYREHYAKRLPR